MFVFPTDPEDRKYPDIYYVALKDEDQNSFLDFQNNIGEKTVCIKSPSLLLSSCTYIHVCNTYIYSFICQPYVYGYGGLSLENAEKAKLPIGLEHPFVNVVGNFAIDAFNSVCNMVSFLFHLLF